MITGSLPLCIFSCQALRVTGGKVVIDGETHQLSLNDFGTKFRHHVHGGKESFDRSFSHSYFCKNSNNNSASQTNIGIPQRKNWECCLSESGDGTIFSLLSPHGEEVGCLFHQLKLFMTDMM